MSLGKKKLLFKLLLGSLCRGPRNSLFIDTEYDRAKVPPYNGNDPPPAPGSLKRSLFPTLLNEVQNKGTQGVQARYGAELPPIISIVRYPSRPVILGMDFLHWCNPTSHQCKRLLLAGSKRPFAPSPDHFRELSLFGQFPRSTASQHYIFNSKTARQKHQKSSKTFIDTFRAAPIIRPLLGGNFVTIFFTYLSGS